MENIQAIIFDRDNTLLHADLERVHVLQEHLRALAPQVSVTMAQELWSSWPGPWPVVATEEPAFWQQFCQTMAATYGLPSSCLDSLPGVFARFYPTMFRAYPDAGPALHMLAQAGYRLVVLSNFELPSIDQTLKVAGLDPGMFELLLTRTILGVAKPEPQAFIATANLLGLRLEQCCLVDDLIEHVVAARELGMLAYHIDRNRADQSAPHRAGTINSLTELAHHLRTRP